MGGKIGRGCYIFCPQTVTIDIARPYLIEMGDNVVITKNVTILTHDYSHTVIRKRYGKQYGDAKGVKIGSNVFIGIDSMVLMGTTIGNNVIIGAKSVVRGNIPDDVVVVSGNPARVVCTLEEYYNKRKDSEIKCAVNNVLLCEQNLNRIPAIQEMGDAFAWLYLPHTNETIEKFPQFFNLSGDNRDDLMKCFLESKPKFGSYEDFINWVHKK